LAVAVQIRRLLTGFFISKSLPDIHPPVAGCVPPPFQWTLFTVKFQNADNFTIHIQTVTGRCFSVCQQVPFINTAIGIRVALNPFDNPTLVILKDVYFQIAVGVRLEFNDIPGWRQMDDPVRLAVVIRIFFYDPSAGCGQCRAKNTPNQQIHAENEQGRFPSPIPETPDSLARQMFPPKKAAQIKKATNTGQLL